MTGDWWLEARRLVEVEGLTVRRASLVLGVSESALWWAKRRGWMRGRFHANNGRASRALVVALVRQYPGARTRELHARQDRLGYTWFFLLFREAARQGLVIATLHTGDTGRYSAWRPA